ncbi:hypothetical protein OQA88_7665 [Cercophora sp. LCS_1]
MVPYFGMKGKWLTFWVTTACAVVMALFGYGQGVFVGIIATPDFLDQFDLQDNPSLQGNTVSVYNLGCFFGALCVLVIGEPLGRKRTIVFGTIIMAVGALLQIAAFDIPQMIVGRVVAGVGNGINTATAPVWLTEMAKPSLRGKLIVSAMIANIFGFMLSNWVTFAFALLNDGSLAWRLPLAIQLIFVFAILCIVPWLPESPRWLISKDRIGEATGILADLSGVDRNNASIIAQSKTIQAIVRWERRHPFRWRGLIRGRVHPSGNSTLRRLVLGIGIQAMQQLTGINAAWYYLPILTQSLGLGSALTRLITACNSVNYLLFSFLAISYIEKWGRRKLLTYAALAQATLLTPLAILTSFSKPIAIIPLIFLLHAIFATAWHPIPWLYPAEVNALGMRSKGAALATATNWVVQFMVVEITPRGIEMGWRFWVVWTVANLGFAGVVWGFYEETTGRGLEEGLGGGWWAGGVKRRAGRDEDGVSGRRATGHREGGGQLSEGRERRVGFIDGVVWDESERDVDLSTKKVRQGEGMLRNEGVSGRDMAVVIEMGVVGGGSGKGIGHANRRRRSSEIGPLET